MEWDEFKNLKLGSNAKSNYEYKETLTDINCPICGDKIYRDDSVILTSIPPKYRYFCKKCKWNSYA